MVWKDNMLIGVPEIDAQHKELCRRIDDLFAACAQGRGRDELGKTVAYLEDYTKQHFGNEEKLQQKVGYPLCREHKAMHTGFLNSVAELRKELDQKGPTIAMVAKINSVVVDWLINHIQKMDTGIAPYVNQTRA